MKKLIVCVGLCLIANFAGSKVVSAGESPSAMDETRVEKYISGVYRQIDFSKCDRLPYDVFDKAYHGYLNLKFAGKLSDSKDVISVCDFNLPSTENRLWIIDLRKRKVLFNTYVAHGQGSGEDCASSFSNNMDSHQSSLGFYVTGETYQGDHGTSLRLFGMDRGFNDAAYDRGIVVHGAEYVSDKFVDGNQRLGRSWGCPAVPAGLSLPIINTIKDGTCVFIYYPDRTYLRSAFWLNKKVDHLPGNEMYADMKFADAGIMPKRYTTIQYIHNGKIDSTKTVALGD